MKNETELEMVQRHVREGEIHVKRQREIIIEIQERGGPTEVALKLLDNFEGLQREHNAHLARLKAENPDAAPGIFKGNV